MKKSDLIRWLKSRRACADGLAFVKELWRTSIYRDGRNLISVAVSRALASNPERYAGWMEWLKHTVGDDSSVNFAPITAVLGRPLSVRETAIARLASIKCWTLGARLEKKVEGQVAYRARMAKAKRKARR